MSNNDDLINDILNELDNNKKSEPVADKPEEADALAAEPEVKTSAEENTASPELPENSPREETEPTAEPEAHEDNPYDENYPENMMYGQYGAPDRGAAPQRPVQRKKKKKKKQRNRLPGVLILVTLIFAVSICCSMVIIAFGKDMLGIGKSDNARTITIYEGATTDQIAQMLKDEGIIKSPKFFKLFSRLRKTDDAYLPGEYLIRPNMAYETIIKKLTTNERANKEAVDITFPEGFTIYDAAELLEKEGVCSADDFIFNFNAGGYGLDFEQYLPTDFSMKYLRMEGYLFPDTYFFYKEMDAVEVCQKIYVTFNKRMNELNLFTKIKQMNVTMDDVITLASIVQKEAANTADMKKIASVFWNRLHNSDTFPRLESDPTKNYSERVLSPHMEVKNQKILRAYDTYIGEGLPPGAICNPGLDAIAAVLDPEETDYFFFVANIDTGLTLFARTDEEHEQNKEIIKQQQAEAAAAAAAQGGNQ